MGDRTVIADRRPAGGTDVEVAVPIGVEVRVGVEVAVETDVDVAVGSTVEDRVGVRVGVAEATVFANTKRRSSKA